MKKLLSALIILTMLVCAFSCVAFADVADFTVDGTVPSDKTIAQAIQGQASKTGVTSTIVMNKDLEIPAHNNSPIKLNAGYDIVLDLGGNTLTTYRYFDVDGKLTIKNGTIVDKSGYREYTMMVNTDGGHLVLDDVTLEASASTGAITLGQDTVSTQLEIYGDTVVNTVYNVVFSNTPNSKTTIFDGTFTSTKNGGRILKVQLGACNIYGGKFTNTVNPGVQASVAFGDSYNNKNLVIYGGTYSFNPTNWKAADVTVSQNEALYTAAPKDAVFNVEGKDITTSWLGALNAVENDGIIKLTEDVTLDYTLKVENTDKKFTFDLNGNTLTNTSQATGGNSAAIFHLADNSDVTIVNGKILTTGITAENAIMQGKSWRDKGSTSTLTLGGDGNELLITADPTTNLIASDAINGKIVVNEGVSLIIPEGSNATNNIYAMGTVEINGGIFENNGNGSPGTGFINNLKFTEHASKVDINGGTFKNNIEVECTLSKITIKGGTFKGNMFNDPASGMVNYSYQDRAPAGYYANEYDGYVKVETTSNKESVTAAIANASYDDGKGENTVTKRFFKMVNSLDYAVVGFEIKAGEYTWDIPLTSVYSKVLVNGKVYNAGENEYVLTGAIGDVPNNYDGGFEVSAYAIDFEGNKVELN